MTTFDDLAVTVADLQVELAALALRMTAVPSAQCSPAFPHPNRLSYLRGPNRYLCECGQVYEKDGRGGLREVS